MAGYPKKIFFPFFAVRLTRHGGLSELKLLLFRFFLFFARSPAWNFERLVYYWSIVRFWQFIYRWKANYNIYKSVFLLFQISFCSSFNWAGSGSISQKSFSSQINRKILDFKIQKGSMRFVLSRRVCTYFYFFFSFKIDRVMGKKVCEKKTSWWFHHRFFSSHSLPCIFLNFFRLTRHGALAEQQKMEKRFFSGNPPWWVKRIHV